MTSVFLTRRAMLSGSAMLSIGTLFAACGQQAPSASATLKPVVTRGYSGGSKAPDGEYRKADGYGPAQNVPLPKAEP